MWIKVAVYTRHKTKYFLLSIYFLYRAGTGGNNHAVEYYEQTKYPLVVKLGTITSEGGDVYSYAENEMVEDPKLKEHLLHFGINIALMEKVSFRDVFTPVKENTFNQNIISFYQHYSPP